jgi:hypothetical protein
MDSVHSAEPMRNEPVYWRDEGILVCNGISHSHAQSLNSRSQVESESALLKVPRQRFL